MRTDPGDVQREPAGDQTARERDSGRGHSDDSAASASSLIEHIQGVMEHQKALLARDLHDELGGLLVGAVMDLAWAEQHLSAPPAELKQKLLRARQTLATAIDMKRKLIEELRPTLLDNVGLFAALRWHVQAACKRAGATCVVEVPEEERRFLPNVPIALFRIVQEALAVIVARKPVASTQFTVTVDRRSLTILFRTDAAGEPQGEESGRTADVHYLAAIRQRVASLRGEFHHDYIPAVGTLIAIRFPPDYVLMPGSLPG
ncbi:MAG TPA: histidine kinase [Steroidobacteraceae bacterium]|nr:histidine kinase [Steroidobacteraceae bacterium]